MPTVKQGTEFHSAHADANPRWVVKSVRGDVADCEVMNVKWEHNGVWYDDDFAGMRKPFYVSDIERILTYQALHEASMKANDAFFASLEPGTVVHYHDAFGRFVRCEAVVYEPDVHASSYVGKDYEPGSIVLLPIALVGAWEKDLPRTILISPDTAAIYTERNAVRVDADTYAFVLDNCYHAKKIAERAAWRPHSGCVWEHTADLQTRYPDVPTLEPHSLNPADNVIDQRNVTA